MSSREKLATQIYNFSRYFKNLGRSEKLATSYLQARWGDVARYVLECVAWAWYQSGELNEEELQRFLGYDTRLQVHVFLRQHGLPLRDTVVNQKPTQRSQRNST